MFEKIRDILGLKSVLPQDLRKETKRISWDHIFLIEAKLWSRRSPDAQTQCGCVLTKDNTVLSTGYNGFIRGVDDKALPNLRPFKYDFMIHAEHNAILNCARSGVTTVGATAYITGEPCNPCLQYMWQAGINRVVYSDWNNPEMMKNDAHKRVRRALLKLMNPYFDDLDEELIRMEMVFVPSTEIQENELGIIFVNSLYKQKRK
jgi:dCMP deaminase